MTNDGALKTIRSGLHAVLDQVVPEGSIYTDELVETVTNAVSAYLASTLNVEPVTPGCQFQVPGRDAVITVAPKPPADAQNALEMEITITGPDARAVAREWGWDVLETQWVDTATGRRL